MLVGLCFFFENAVKNDIFKVNVAVIMKLLLYLSPLCTNSRLLQHNFITATLFAALLIIMTTFLSF